jgi:hypothetical protein
LISAQRSIVRIVRDSFRQRQDCNGLERSMAEWAWNWPGSMLQGCWSEQLDEHSVHAARQMWSS